MHLKKINNLKDYISDFFNELEMISDRNQEHNYKSFIRGSIDEFLANETTETAFAVYQTFFDIYRLTNEETKNPFIDLLDTLRNYEENAATLLDKQRDHYIHSVNVFILGIAVYSQNKKYQEIFNKVAIEDSPYICNYTTKHEEFFYQWGIAALFHDVGYPAEITINQINKFFGLVTSISEERNVIVHIGIDDFDKINSIPPIIPKTEFTSAYSSQHNIHPELDLLRPLDLLAHKLHLSFNLDLKSVKEQLYNYTNILDELGFVDHGFYSSLIVLKWYGYLMQKSNTNPEKFYYAIVDSASAIFLHNYYRNYIGEEKYFNHGPMHPEEHPIAWLLILCDEIQEWNRKAYGVKDKNRITATDVSIFITDIQMDVTYITAKGKMSENFAEEKESTLNQLLYFKTVFTHGFSVGCETMDTLSILATKASTNAGIVPRPLMENLEKLAIAIHNLYNQEQLKRYPDKELEYPRFADMNDSMKYSNLRQARDIVKKLELIGCEILPIESEGVAVTSFSSDEIEFLAIYEHELWMKERIASGWTYGSIKDVEKKKSPYLIPYDQLSNDIKQLDRDTIINIPYLVNKIGMAVYRKNS